ncbi:MAG TPA: DUF5666 domain-containing protein [Acidimicrobiales bacterium]|nr:MAG: hypothetical protein B7Z69_02635 [Actinobacteria bacterium 21-73-9]HQU25463.1 DUF5666 domain-containing protein [Acidimicrobiales bacterium]
MTHPTPAVLGRSLAALAVTAGLGLGVASVAGADSGHGHGRSHDNGGGGDHAAGYVMAMTATTLNVESAGGVTTTYTISPTTTYTLDGQAATAALLVVGDRVEVTTASGAPTTATAVNIDLAEIHGLVLSVSGSTVLVIGPEGFTRTVMAGASTVVTSGGQASALTSITPGEAIVAEGTIDSTGTILDALTIKVRVPEQQRPERVSGVVSAVTPGASVTVSGDHGASATYTLTSSTTYTEGPTTVPSTDLLVGEHVSITTAPGAPTTAASIDIRPLVVRGSIGTVGTGTFSVTHDGATTTVVVEPTTKVYDKGQLATASVAFTTGEHVVVAGLPDATSASTLDAQVIVVGTGEGWGPLGPGLGLTGNAKGPGHHRGHQR